MAYQNVGTTPRFYIDYLSYLNMTGKYNLTSYYDTFQVGLNPSSISEINIAAEAEGSFAKLGDDSTVAIPKEMPINFWATLGHNWGGAKDAGRVIVPHFHMHEDSEDGYQQCQPNHVEIVNSDSGTDTTFQSDFDGFTITELTASEAGFSPDGQIEDIGTIFLYSQSAATAYLFRTGATAIGKYYDMPVAPDLSLSLEHDYSGIKKTTSMSGASFSNANWIKPPKWGDKEAWQLGDFPRPYSGRRVWDLSFSYISDSDLEPRNYTGTTDDTPPQQGTDNWFENVLHYTMGGHLPFIFQPNKDATYVPEGDYIGEIPELAICRFDMDTFSREQVAVNVYNIKVKIKETW